ncbi:MAG TPA: hypothetical protein VFY89_08225 [Ktedonobacterales bacterium]
MRIVGRIFYGIAATLGLISIGTEIRDRQNQARNKGMFAKHPTHTGLFMGLWALALAVVGKVFEDYERQQPTTTARPTSRGFMPRRAKTLRSDYDLSDQYTEQVINRRPLAAVR